MTGKSESDLLRNLTRVKGSVVVVRKWFIGECVREGIESTDAFVIYI